MTLARGTRVRRRADGAATRTGPRPRRVLVTSTVVLAALCLAASCGGGASTTAGRKMTRVQLMLDWTPNTNHSGFYLARQRGFYRDAGLDVSIVEPGQGANVEQAVGTGVVQFGVSASEQVVPARQAGIPILSIAALIQHNTSSLISLESSGITRPRDLAGHTYGAFGGTFEKALIESLVRCDGGDPSRVRFTKVGDVDYRDGLTRHQYDTVWVFEGWDVIRIADIDKVPLATIPFAEHTDCIPDWYTPVLITSERLAAGNPALVRRFVQATAKGYRMAMADPSAAADALLAGANGLDRDLVTRSAAFLASRYAEDPDAWGRQSAAVWSRFVAFLTQQHIITPGFDSGDAFTNKFLDPTG